MQPTNYLWGTILIFLLFIFSTSFTYAQQAIIATGNTISDSGGSVSFSIGQISNQSFSSDNLIIIEGVQQTFDDLPSLVWNIPVENELINIFPNPTQQSIHIKMKKEIDKIIELKIYDEKGILIWSQKPDSNMINIDVTNYATGIYYIITKTNQNYQSSHKLVKTN